MRFSCAYEQDWAQPIIPSHTRTTTVAFLHPSTMPLRLPRSRFLTIIYFEVLLRKQPRSTNECASSLGVALFVRSRASSCWSCSAVFLTTDTQTCPHDVTTTAVSVVFSCCFLHDMLSPPALLALPVRQTLLATETVVRSSRSSSDPSVCIGERSATHRLLLQPASQFADRHVSYCDV